MSYKKFKVIDRWVDLTDGEHRLIKYQEAIQYSALCVQCKDRNGKWKVCYDTYTAWKRIYSLKSKVRSKQ